MSTTALIAILLPISLMAFGLFGKFAFDMRDKPSVAWAWATASLLPGSVSALYLTTADAAMSVNTRNYILGVLGGAAGCCTAIWIGYALAKTDPSVAMPPKSNQDGRPDVIIAQSPPNSLTNNQGIVTFGQSGGSNTVYNGAPLAQLGPDALPFIRKNIPDGSKVMIIKNANDSPSAEMEQRISKLLTDNGYQIAGSGIGIGGQYFKGIQVNSKPNSDGTYTIIIGDPRAGP